MAAEDISTLVMQVKSDGIRESTDALKSLITAAKNAEKASRTLGTEVASGAVTQTRASGSANAMAEAMDTTTRATSKLTLEQRKQVYEYNESVKAFKAAAEEAYKINAAIDKNTTANATATKAADNYDASLQRQMRSMMQLQIQANAMNKAVNEATPANRAQAIAVASGTEALAKNTHGHGSNAAAIREGMVLMHELSQGSYKRFGGSLMVLANQLDVIPKLMDFIKTSTMSAILGWTLAATAVASVVVGIGFLTFNLIAGAREQKHFNDALIQTGNFAGTTADGLHEIARAASSMGGTIGTAKEAVLLLAQTGAFTKEQIRGIGEVAVLTEEAFGVSVEKTVKEYETLATLAITSTARSTNVITQHAMKMNDHYHALSAAQIQSISLLEKEGKATEAAALAVQLFSSAQKERAEESIASLGYVARAWHGIKAAISGAADAIGQIGAKSTLASQIRELQVMKEQQAKMMPNQGMLDRSNAGFDKAIADLRKQADAADAAAAKKGADVRLEQERSHASERLRVIIEANDKTVKKKRELAELDHDYEIQTDAEKLKQKSGYEAARAKIIADGEAKPAKGSDTTRIDRDADIDAIKAASKQKTMAYEEFIRHSKELANKQGEDQRANLRERETAYDQEIKQLDDALAKELDRYNKFGSKRADVMAANKKKAAAAQAEHDVKVTQVGTRRTDDETQVQDKEYAANKKLMEQTAQLGAAETKRLDAAIKAEERRLAGVDALKSAQAQYSADVEAGEAKKLESENAQINSMLANNQYSDDVIAHLKQEMVLNDKHIAQHKTLSKLREDESKNLKKMEANDRTGKNLDEALASAKRFEKGMVSVFSNVGKAIGGIAVSFVQMQKDRNDAQQTFNKASKEDIDNGTAKAALDAANTDATLSGYSNMIDASKSFFDTKSKGYAITEGISKAFHAAEMVRSGLAMAKSIAAGTAKIFEQLGAYAWPVIGAMAATMAAFGFSVAGSSSGGGKTAAEQQKTQGTGSVFGDVGTANADGTTTYKSKSESISKSIDLLEKNSTILLPVNQAMLTALKGIEAAMSGLTNLLVRTTGVTNGTNMNIATGTIASQSIWGKTTQNIVDSGISYGGKVSNLQAGLGYNQYASVDTTKSSWFGLSKSTSNSVKTQGLSNELSQQFGLIFTNLEGTLKTAAGSLGKSSEDVGKAIENMVLSSTTVSLKDLSGQDLTDAINSVISKSMDEIAAAAFPAMDDFRKVGEGYSQTVIRVATGIQTATGALDQLGIAAINYQNITNKQGDVDAEIVRQSVISYETLNGSLSGIGAIVNGMTGTVDDLVSAYKSLDAIRTQMNGTGLNGYGLNANVVKGAGSVSALGTALSSYQDKYFTDQEKAAIMLKSLTAEFGKLGVAVPASKAALRDLITETGVDTEANAVLTGQLLSLTAAYSDAVDANNTANASAISALKTSIDAFNDFKDSIKSFKDSLLLGDLSTLTPTEKYIEAKKQYEDTVTKAMSGDTTAQGNVTSAAQAYLEASKVVNASDAEYSKSMAQVMGDMDKLSAYTGTQLTDAQAQLAVLNAQADSLNLLNATAADIKTSLDNVLSVLPTTAVTVDTSTADQIAALRQEQADQAAASAKQIADLTAALYDATQKAADTSSGGLKGLILDAAHAVTVQNTSYER